MPTTAETNREFYNSTYRSRWPLLGLLHTYASYDQQSKSRRNFRAIRFALPDLPADQRRLRFLDYGFGHGSLLLKIPGDIATFGCEISEEAVAKVRKISTLLRRNITVGGPDELECFAVDGSFDIIACSHVLEHVDDAQGLLQRLVGLLAPTGVLLVNLPINEVWRDPNHVRDYDVTTAVSLLDSCGLEADSVLETDRLTAAFLTREHAHKRAAPIARMVTRLLRLVFGLLPLSAADVAESFLPESYRYQQLIIVARPRRSWVNVTTPPSHERA